MSVIGGIIAVGIAIYLFSIPFGPLAKAVQSVVRFNNEQWSMVYLGIVLFFILLTLVIGIVIGTF